MKQTQARSHVRCSQVDVAPNLCGPFFATPEITTQAGQRRGVGCSGTVWIVASMELAQ